jgi:DNA-binding FrmR family transcriptional regulator
MKNKELFINKMSRIDGKLKTIRVMVTRQGTTVQDIHSILDQIDSEMSDLSTMVEREGTAYNR